MSRSITSSPFREIWKLRAGGVVALLVGLIGCEGKLKGPELAKAPKQVPVISAPTQDVRLQRWPRLVRAQGTLIADESTQIASKVSGRVEQVHVDLGDNVQEGMPLVTIERTQFQLLVDQAEAQLAQARSVVGLKEGEPVQKLNPDNAAPVREARAVWDEATQSLKRLQLLSKQNAISATDLEVAESAERVAAARLTSAQNNVRERLASIRAQTAQLELAKQNLVDTVVLAPYEGVIQDRAIAEGSFVQAGQSILTLVKTSVVRFRGAVPERYAHELKLGQSVQVRLETSGQTREAKVTRISPTLDPLNRSLTFESDVANPDGSLRSGMFGEAQVVLDPEATAIVIPTRSLIRFAGVDKVWKVEQGMVREQVLRLGRTEGSMQEVVTGLKEGDRILQDASQGKAGKYEPPAAKDPDRGPQPEPLPSETDSTGP
jgi:RND family efflux transporter MFP subunit